MNGAAIPAAAACILLGSRAAGKLKDRENLLTAWEASLQRMEGAVAFNGAALPRVLEAGKDPLLPELDEVSGPEVFDVEAAGTDYGDGE